MEEALEFYRYQIYRYQILILPECQLSIALTLQECIYVTVVLVFQTRTASIFTVLFVIREVNILILYPNIADSIPPLPTIRVAQCSKHQNRKNSFSFFFLSFSLNLRHRRKPYDSLVQCTAFILIRAKCTPLEQSHLKGPHPIKGPHL